jgi:hypothetical protein
MFTSKDRQELTDLSQSVSNIKLDLKKIIASLESEDSQSNIKSVLNKILEQVQQPTSSFDLDRISDRVSSILSKVDIMYNKENVATDESVLSEIKKSVDTLLYNKEIETFNKSPKPLYKPKEQIGSFIVLSSKPKQLDSQLIKFTHEYLVFDTDSQQNRYMLESVLTQFGKKV